MLLNLLDFFRSDRGVIQPFVDPVVARKLFVKLNLERVHRLVEAPLAGELGIVDANTKVGESGILLEADVLLALGTERVEGDQSLVAVRVDFRVFVRLHLS